MFRYRAFDFSSSLFRVAYCIAQRPCPSPQIDRAKARQALRTAPRRAVGRELFLNESLPAVSLLDWVLTGCDGKRDGAGHGAHDAAPFQRLAFYMTHHQTDSCFDRGVLANRLWMGRFRNWQRTQDLPRGAKRIRQMRNIMGIHPPCQLAHFFIHHEAVSHAFVVQAYMRIRSRAQPSYA